MKPETQGTELVDVTWRVLDERGAPVVGATVGVSQARRPAAAAFLGAGISITTRTDESGSFTARVPRGAKDLVARVSAEGFVDAQAALAEGATEMRVRLEPAWTLRGVVVARDSSQPVAGIPVHAFLVGTSTFVGAGSTDAQGRFSIPGVPVESLDVRVEELTAVSNPASGAARPSPPPRFAPARVAGVAAHSGELRIELVPGLSITGRLVDSQGAPVCTRVSLAVIGQTLHGGPDYSVRRLLDILDDRGVFRVDGLGEGLYDLAFEPHPPAAAAGGAVRSIGAAPVASVAAGTCDLTVVLTEGAPIRVRVLGPDGKAIRGGYVCVSETGRPVGSLGTVMAEPGPDGVYATAPLDRSKTFDLLFTGFPSSLEARREALRPGGEAVVVTLERGGRISGQVLDAEGRAVSARVPVRASTQGVSVPGVGTGWVGYTDAAGRFVLDSLGDHAFTLAAGGGESGFMAAAEVRDVRIGRDDLVLRVRRGVEITGRLRDSVGRPVRTHYMAAHAVDPGTSASASAIASWTRIDSDDGSFMLRGVPPGRVRLSCYVGERFVQLGEFDAPATDLEIVVPDP